jgi:hypothetical protein
LQLKQITKTHELPVVLSIDFGKRNFSYWLGSPMYSASNAAPDSIDKLRIAFWAWGRIDCGKQASTEGNELGRTLEGVLFGEQLVHLIHLATDVVVEKQVRRNGSMCRLSRYLIQAFRKRHKPVVVRHAGSKFITCGAKTFGLVHSHEKRQRKLISDVACGIYMEQPHVSAYLDEWRQFYLEQAKRDDFADCFWQAIDHMLRAHAQKLLSTLGIVQLARLISEPKRAFESKKKKQQQQRNMQKTKSKSKAKKNHHTEKDDDGGDGDKAKKRKSHDSDDFDTFDVFNDDRDTFDLSTSMSAWSVHKDSKVTSSTASLFESTGSLMDAKDTSRSRDEHTLTGRKRPKSSFTR